MKKLTISIFTLFILSLVFVSCKKNSANSEPDMQILELSDITDDWLSGYTWSGKTTYDIDTDAWTKLFIPSSLDQDDEIITHKTYSAYDLKEIIKQDGKTVSDSSNTKTCIKANAERTKMKIEMILTTKVMLTTVKTIETTTVTRD